MAGAGDTASGVSCRCISAAGCSACRHARRCPDCSSEMSAAAALPSGARKCCASSQAPGSLRHPLSFGQVSVYNHGPAFRPECCCSNARTHRVSSRYPLSRDLTDRAICTLPQHFCKLALWLGIDQAGIEHSSPLVGAQNVDRPPSLTH